ncbi:flavin reductase family protein [Streptomyces sp. NPDC020965]|uniref:flavin reductase family protein n=1 Tax=Streptomyces sp. NPDC020965 TaxID=3365105 RepID=UPI0037B9590E
MTPLTGAGTGGPAAAEFRDAMRRWATGVAVVTTEGPDGPHGMTVNSLLSISLDPPTLLISLKRGSRTHGILERTPGFTVNILAGEQRELADRFTRRREIGEHEFDGVRRRPSPDGGGPELEGGLAVLTCRTTERVEVADHSLIIATVSRARVAPADDRAGALLYAGRGYHRLTGLASPTGPAPLTGPASPTGPALLTGLASPTEERGPEAAARDAVGAAPTESGCPRG